GGSDRPDVGHHRGPEPRPFAVVVVEAIAGARRARALSRRRRAPRETRGKRRMSRRDCGRCSTWNTEAGMKRSKPLVRKVPLQRRKPMKRFREKRRPGNRPMTDTQLQRVIAAKELVCIPCLVWAMAGHMPREHVARVSQYDHSKSGN